MSDDEQIKEAIDGFLKVVLMPDGTSLTDEGRILSFKFACGRVQVDVLSKDLEIPQKRQISISYVTINASTPGNKSLV